MVVKTILRIYSRRLVYDHLGLGLAPLVVIRGSLSSRSSVCGLESGFDVWFFGQDIPSLPPFPPPPKKKNPKVPLRDSVTDDT